MLVAFEQRVDQTRITPANLLHLPTTVDRRKQEIRFLAEDSPKLAADGPGCSPFFYFIICYSKIFLRVSSFYMVIVVLCFRCYDFIALLRFAVRWSLGFSVASLSCCGPLNLKFSPPSS